MGQKHRLIGLDPGLRYLGWGVIEAQGNGLVHIANGTISSGAGDGLGHRLVVLEKALEEIFTQYQPSQAAVEKTFVNKDGAATLKLGQARAICMLVPARRGLTVAEYAPNFIKRAVTGAGHAGKEQMVAMVNMLLPQANPQSDHAADALAVAIAHANAGDLDGKIAHALQAQDKIKAKVAP